jgi:hypothetical protein
VFDSKWHKDKNGLKQKEKFIFGQNDLKEMNWSPASQILERMDVRKVLEPFLLTWKKKLKKEVCSKMLGYVRLD